MDFHTELTALLNRYSKENDSDTPDWVLANYLIGCLQEWGDAMAAREKWHGREKSATVEVSER